MLEEELGGRLLVSRLDDSSGGFEEVGEEGGGVAGVLPGLQDLTQRVRICVFLLLKNHYDFLKQNVGVRENFPAPQFFHPQNGTNVEAPQLQQVKQLSLTNVLEVVLVLGLHSQLTIWLGGKSM